MNDTQNPAPKSNGPRSPYRVFLWGGLIMAALCFGLAAQRLGIQRPARADAYFITGILGILSAAMAWSLGAAAERARRSQESLRESLDRLQDRMHDMPRSLMEESVKAAAREAEDRRADQERQARIIQAALENQMEKVRTLTEVLSGKWEETLRAQRESFAGEWREVLAKSQAQLDQGATAQNSNARQAEEWLRSLSAAAGSVGEALETMRRVGEDSAGNQAALQAEWRATVEMFHHGMGGVLDRLQALGSYAQGQEALLQRMDDTIRAFEERSADLIEDTAMKAQESLLDALDQAGARDAALAGDKG